MNKYMVSLSFSLLMGSYCWAEMMPQQPTQLSQPEGPGMVAAPNASGESQSTVIDAGGNLKMVPNDQLPQSGGKQKNKGPGMNQGPGSVQPGMVPMPEQNSQDSTDVSQGTMSTEMENPSPNSMPGNLDKSGTGPTGPTGSTGSMGSQSPQSGGPGSNGGAPTTPPPAMMGR